MNQKTVARIGWFASVMAILMYVSYIDQIIRNIEGHPGSIILPITTTVNCLAWATYAWYKEKRDWPIIMANIPGIILGIITAVTGILYSH